MSRATQAWARGPERWTNCPGTLALGSEVPRCRPVVPGDWGTDLKALGVDQLSRENLAWLREPAGLTSNLGHLHLGPRACKFEQLSRATRAQV